MSEAVDEFDRSAMRVAKWQRIQRAKKMLPFIRYVAVMDGRTRPDHAKCHGVILPVDHPWWDTHNPLFEADCRCTVQALNQRMMDQRGWTVTLNPPQ